MKNAVDFISFALSHAKAESVPEGAKLPISLDECGTEPWEYLYGTTGFTVTKGLLDERYNDFYRKKGWTREAFDFVTENWVALKRKATDCQGLLDAFLGTDVTANYCYTAWCTDRGSVEEITRPYELGEALFYRNGEGRMTHVGFVCGFLNGEPLAVEARGIRFGVVVTRFSERPWTHRGLVTRRLSYDPEYRDEQVILSVRRPMIQGESILNLQKALNALGYYCGSPDGKCGKLTMSGVMEFVRAHENKFASPSDDRERGKEAV
ncbi:MAG: peptidoglycan-binding protein [Clostridiales bacterium]|nr:peptidoglycan-binding protein [Clostridiales bacterium]